MHFERENRSDNNRHRLEQSNIDKVGRFYGIIKIQIHLALSKQSVL